MNTPSWLMKILFSYLSGRSLIVSYKGATADPKVLPAGAPAGTVLGGLIFIVKVNGLLLRPSIPRKYLEPSNIQASVKFMDDATSACSINLRETLIPDPVDRQSPLTYHEKDRLILPLNQNPLKPILEDIEDFTIHQNLKINESKTEVMVFNMSKCWQFPPEVGFSADKNLDYVRKAKVLGIMVSDDLKWAENTDYITSKALARLWTLRRLKNLGISNDVIFDVYPKEIRTILEFGVPVWNGGITFSDSAKIEAIQKKAFKIILQDQYGSYSQACDFFKTETLCERRVKICLKFAKKELSKDNSIFTRFIPSRATRFSEKQIVTEIL